MRSATWAAYADALGFITELAQPSTLFRRIENDYVERAQPWRRRVGGKFGVEVELPAGTYSDDTQLRLSTSRAIRGDGTFDVEAFAKVELPVWLSYGLGGGRGTKAAASNLAKREVTWETNFFKGYVDGGGNGAAMRIQPHVWAARPSDDDERVLLNVAKNTIVTHGHPIALIGAAAHALTLRITLREDEIPPPAHLDGMVEKLRRLPEIMMSDDALHSAWMPLWDREARRSFTDSYFNALDDFAMDVKKATTIVRDKSEPHEAYGEMLKRFGAYDDARRGTATTTAILASSLAWLFAAEPREGVLLAANALGSDTDTIASMAGALLGVTADASPDTVMDLQYIGAEAKRLHDISEGVETKTFPYPSLIEWEAPRTQLDAVVAQGEELRLKGLGTLRPGPIAGEVNDSIWQWCQLDTRTNHLQSVIVKRRRSPRVEDPHLVAAVVHRGLLAVQRVVGASPAPETPPHRMATPRGSFDLARVTLDDVPKIAQACLAANFDPAFVGQALLAVLDGPDGFEAAVLLAQALRRMRKR